MMGASASAGGGRAAIYTGLVAGVERAGRGYGVTRVERVVQGCSKAFPNSERLAGPRTFSTILFPLCFQYTFLKGNKRRPARRSRFGHAWRAQNETESCTRQSENSQPPTQEFWNLSSTIHPPRPTLSRSLNAAPPLHSIPPAAPASSRPSTTMVTLSHTRANISHIQPRVRCGPRASASS